MQLTALFEAEEAVTPVIGIILMVAITVILAAVIGVFSLGLTDQTMPEGPNVIVAFDYDGTGHTSGDTDSWGTDFGTVSADGLLHFTHDQGTQVPPERLDLVVESGTSGGPFTDSTVDGQEFYDTGDELSVWVQEDDTARIVWQSPDGSKSTAVAVWNGD